MTPSDRPIQARLETLERLAKDWRTGAKQCRLHALLNHDDVRCQEGGLVLDACACQLEAILAGSAPLDYSAVLRDLEVTAVAISAAIVSLQQMLIWEADQRGVHLRVKSDG